MCFKMQTPPSSLLGINGRSGCERGVWIKGGGGRQYWRGQDLKAGLHKKGSVLDIYGAGGWILGFWI